MATRPPGGMIEETAGLLARAPSLIALLILAALAAAYGLFATMGLSQLYLDFGAATFGMLMTLIGLAQSLVAMAVQFFLSRRLGSDGAPGQADVGAWIGFSLLYMFVSWLASMVGTIISTPLAGGRIWIVPIVFGLTALLVRIALFPLLVRLVALAHDRAGPKYGRIWRFVTAEQPGVYLGYCALCVLAALATGLAVFVQTVGSATSAGPGMALLGGLVQALFQLLLMLYAISAYRALRARDSESGVFS